jgi:NAD(P)-dependent dehydrogenase (short-subunit alcohol dehydrogenase family)
MLPTWAQGLSGRVAVVTGASRGLGSAIALCLAEAGAKVHAVARSDADLRELAAQHTNILPMVGDVTDPRFIEDLGKMEIDILVNNAGMNRPLLIEDVDLETLDILQEMLNDYPGTVIVVSHDRDFLDRTATSVIVSEGEGQWLEYAGGYSDMVAQRGYGVLAPGAAAPGAGHARRRHQRADPRPRRPPALRCAHGA